MIKIGEIKERLAETADWEAWMDDIRQDPRKNVQAALAAWQRKKNLRDKQQHAHDQKNRVRRFF
nr:hypothetical protein [Planococcus glaciei]